MTTEQIKPETGVCFLRALTALRLRERISQADLGTLGICADLATADRWIAFGAVYVDGRRTTEDREIDAGQVVRVHTRPKRFPNGVPGPHWLARLAENQEDFLVLDKPGGCPTHATLDNAVENAKYALERTLGIPLYTTHRLDIATRGLLLFAKSPRAQAGLNRRFAERKIEKIYLAKSRSRVPPGHYVHYMDRASRVPRSIQEPFATGWWDCRLQVEESGPLPSGDHWHRVRLITGRTHQIRAQFAALGSPLTGDPLYGGREEEELGLECAEMAFEWRGRLWRVRRSARERA